MLYQLKDQLQLIKYHNLQGLVISRGLRTHDVTETCTEGLVDKKVSKNLWQVDFALEKIVELKDCKRVGSLDHDAS